MIGEFASDSRVGAVHLSRNFGQQLAIAAGLAMADADAVVLLDGDLQDPPEIIPELIEKWEVGYDVVFAIKKIAVPPVELRCHSVGCIQSRPTGAICNSRRRGTGRTVFLGLARLCQRRRF